MLSDPELRARTWALLAAAVAEDHDGLVTLAHDLELLDARFLLTAVAATTATFIRASGPDHVSAAITTLRVRALEETLRGAESHGG